MIKNKINIFSIVIFLALISIIIYLLYKHFNQKQNYVLKNNSTKELNNLQQNNLQQELNNNKKLIQNLNRQLTIKQQAITNLNKDSIDLEFEIYQNKYYTYLSNKTSKVTMDILYSANPNYDNYKIKDDKLQSSYPKPSVWWEKTIKNLNLDEGCSGILNKAGEKMPEELGKDIESLLKAIYKGYKEGFSPSATAEMGTSIGLTVLSFALAAAGFGFLNGPIRQIGDIALDIFNPKPAPKPTELSLAIANLKEFIKGEIDAMVLGQQMDSIKTNFDLISEKGKSGNPPFLKDYASKRRSYRVSCDPVSSCNSIVTDPVTGTQKCNFPEYNNNTIYCMTNDPNKGYGNSNYDPNAVFSTGSGSTSRKELENLLMTSAMSDLVYSQNGTTGIPALFNFYYKNVASAVAFFPAYLTMLAYEITFFQEYSLVKTNDILIEKKYYPNPYLSYAIGEYQNILSDNPMQQTGKNLLGSFQQYFKYPEAGKLRTGYLEYVFTMFKLYFDSLDVKETTNGCCTDVERWNLIKCCKFYDIHIGCKAIDCLKYKVLTDTSGVIESRVEPGTNKTLYDALSAKNNDKYYAKEVTIPESEKSKMQQIIFNFLTYFNEALSFPYDTFIKYQKISGYRLYNPNTGEDITHIDLFNNMAFELFFGADGNNFTNKCTKEYSWERIPIKQDLDPEGGYPFGTDRPSYKKGVTAALHPENYTFNNTLIDDIENFNNYCTSIVQIDRGSIVNASPLKLPDDPNTSSGFYDLTNLYCEDPEADCIKSSLLPGRSPGDKDNNIIPNTRKGYCFNNVTKKASNLISTNTPPASRYYKCWNFYFNGVLDVLVREPNEGPYPYRFISGLISKWEESGSYIQIVGGNPVHNGRIKFDSDQNIIFGDGDYVVIDKIIPYLSRLPVHAATDYYKTWTLTSDNQNILLLDFGGNWFINGIPIHNKGWGTFLLYDNSNSFLFGPDETIISGTLNSNKLMNTPITNDVIKLPVPPGTGGNKLWKLYLPTGNISRLELKYGNKYYFDDKLLSNIFTTNLTLNFSTTDSPESDSYVEFGKDEAIISGSIKNQDITLLPMKPNSTLIPSSNLNIIHPTWKIENKSATCAFDYQVYINGNMVLNDHVKLETWTSQTYTANGGDLLEFKASGRSSGGRWNTWSKRLEMGKNYTIYNDCSCFFSGDPCINIVS